MAEARTGDTVKIHYTGRLDDGTVFDSSEGREPLEFKLGEGQVIPGFEQAVTGMQEGESKTAHIAADQAYGPYFEEMVLDVDRAEFPPEFAPELGQVIELQPENGERIIVSVTDVTDQTVTLDGNHPLAGEDLTFDIRLVSIAPRILIPTRARREE